MRLLILLATCFLITLSVAFAADQTINLNATACSGGTSCNTTAYNINDTGIGHTIAKSGIGVADTWSNFPGSANASIRSVQFHLRHSGQGGISGFWTITVRNEAAGTTYCTNTTIAHAAVDTYSMWNTTAPCSWTVSRLDDLEVAFTNNDGGSGQDAFVYYADFFVTYNDIPNATTTLTDTSDPTTADDAITYAATASDPDGDQYRMTVCRTNSITGAYPGTCASGQSLCTSGATDSASQASCSYTTNMSDVGTLTAYAFFCDTGTTTCNVTPLSTTTTVLANNFVPSPTTGLSDTPDPVDETDSIAYAATATDPDGDQYKMTVCRTNAITNGYPGTCAASQTLCTSSATNSASEASCSYATDSNDVGTLTAYAFFCDTGTSTCNSTALSTTTTVDALVTNSFSCSIEQATSCSAGEKYLGLLNDTGGYDNAHAEIYSNANYANSLCCSASTLTMTHTCASTLIKLESTTNSHVEENTESNYAISACLNVTGATVSCEYADTTCPASTVCVLSLLNADGETSTRTNAHVGSCGAYDRKLCCGVNGRPSVPTLITPNDNNYTLFSRYPYFNWTSTDPEGDTITYYWNLSSPAGCAVIPEKTLSTNEYTSVDKLCIDRTYNWTVKACDSIGCSAYATSYNFSIPSTLSITLLNSTVDFGNLESSLPATNVSKNTTANDPYPISYMNTGNVDMATSVKANAAIWSTQSLNTVYFDFSDNGSTTWYNLSSSYQALSSNVTYANGTSELDLRIIVPVGEPSGTKNTTLTVQGASTE
jgi:hypothetical protein